MASDLQSADPAVRAAAAWRAGERGDRDVTGELVEHLDDEDPVVRMAAHESLRRLSGEDFAYRSWAPAQERAQAAARWQAWADRRRSEAPHMVGGRSEVEEAALSEKAPGKPQPAVSDSAPDESGGRFPSGVHLR